MGGAIAESDAGEEVAGARGRIGVAAELERDADVFEGGERGDELETLEDESDFLPAQARPGIFTQGAEIGPVEDDAPRGRGVESGE